MKITKLLSMGMAAAMTITMAGCSGGAGKSAAVQPESTKGQETAGAADQGETTAQAGGAADRSQELVVYSNSTSNGQDEWLLKAAKEEGFKIQIVSIDGSALADRLIAEKNNSVCDVVFGLNAVEYERLKKEELLVKYEPDWMQDVDMSLGDADGYYYPTVVQPLLLVYNKDIITDPPKDWPDLCDPKYKGQYNLFRLQGGTAKMILASIIARYPDPDGEYGVSEEGWEVVKNLYENGYYQQDGDDYISNVIDGTVPMSELWGAGVIRYQKERDVEFGLMLPEIGEPFVVEQVGIISGTKKEALAKDFINWFGSAEIQKGWSDSVGAIPANEKALDMIDDQGIKDLMSKVKIQEVDWALVSEHVNDWVEKVQLEYLE
ncbi:extracellular solute-binding protein [Lacrimispora brassicae]